MKHASRTPSGEALERRHSPRQKRAARTVDAILDTTAELLSEVGFEALSTNKVCAAAGMTPPALYRYFPNKYALLKELGDRLMDRQNRAFLETDIDPENALESITQALRNQYEVTLAQPGGAWIMRSLRATPTLIEVRANSLNRATDGLMERLAPYYAGFDTTVLRRRIRFAVEVGCASLEYIFDVPEEERDKAISDAVHVLAAWALKWDSYKPGRA